MIQSLNSYYEEIDKRIRLEFPQKFGNTVEKTINKPTQNVASATRSARTESQKCETHTFTSSNR